MRNAFGSRLFQFGGAAMITASLSGFTASFTAQAQPMPEPALLTKVEYHCERNITLPVVYIQHAGENAKVVEGGAVIGIEGKLVPMRQNVSGSGALYIALDEQDSYRWHTKGDQGTLLHLAADHTAKEQIILRDCTVKNPVE